MTWSFSRATAFTDLEIRREPDQRFALVVSQPDGCSHIEPFEDPRALLERVLWVQRNLMRQGWRPREPRWLS